MVSVIAIYNLPKMVPVIIPRVGYSMSGEKICSASTYENQSEQTAHPCSHLEPSFAEAVSDRKGYPYCLPSQYSDQELLMPCT
jgi:hypothetical protein